MKLQAFKGQCGDASGVDESLPHEGKLFHLSAWN